LVALVVMTAFAGIS